MSNWKDKYIVFSGNSKEYNMFADLEPGEEWCPCCLGWGWKDIGDKDHFNPRSCTVCSGSGKLDWIENIVGKKPIELNG